MKPDAGQEQRAGASGAGGDSGSAEAGAQQLAEAPRRRGFGSGNAGSKQRIEAFSDGVVAIVITIMVLGIRLPDGTGWADVKGLLKDIFVFLASFAVVGMFWDRHRKMFDYIDRVSDRLVWRNLLFLLVLALIPIFTRWVMLHPEKTVPVLGYGVVFLVANLASTFLFSAATPLFNEQARKVMEMRMQRHTYGFTAVMIVGIALIAAGAFFLPRLAAWLLVGFPILLALVYLWLEQPDIENHIDEQGHIEQIKAIHRKHSGATRTERTGIAGRERTKP